MTIRNGRRSFNPLGSLHRVKVVRGLAPEVGMSVFSGFDQHQGLFRIIDQAMTRAA
jgi:hypothetical protein